jgi:PAS domain S-box-containing protein
MSRVTEILRELLSVDSLKRHWKAWAFLSLGILFTFISAYYTSKDIAEYLKHSFILESKEVTTRISLRLKAHAQILRNGAAFFESSDGITRDEWKTFIQKSQVESNLPGIQGIGYSLLISSSQLQEHINKIRREGFSNYIIRPEGKREVYTSIVYLEPFTWRNQRAFGYDMFTEPVRRVAMEKARDFDIPALSGKVILVQETEADVQAGCLMYVPVYNQNIPTATIDERRAAIKGWVYSPYRMTDLMSGILGDKLSPDENQIQLEIYDGEEISTKNLLFDSKIDEGEVNYFSEKVVRIKTIEFNGHNWKLKYSKIISQFKGEHSARIYIIMIVGTVASLLVFALFVAFIEMRNRSKQLYELSSIITKSEVKYRNFVENSTVGVFQTKLDGTILFVNNALVNMLGYSSMQELMNEKATFYYKDKARRDELVYRLKTNGKIADFEIEFVTKYGKTIILLMNAILLSDYIDGTLIEITNRKAAEKLLEQKTVQLQKTISEKDKFFSIIAHDLKSPFQGFIGITQMMAENPSDFSATELSNISTEMNSKARNLFKLLKNLLEWARVQQGTIPFEPEIIELRNSIMQDIETVKQFAENKSIQIFNDVNEMHKVIADQNMLYSVCQNLLSNAIKFSYRDGKITLKSEEVKNNFIEVSVIDSGIGMSNEIIEKLFKIEERVGQDGTEGEESTGLGLLLCKEFVEKCGGKIWVESEQGKGSKFSFTLPKAL